MISSGELLQHVTDSGIIAVVRAENAEQALRIAEACQAGGIVAIEITYTVPGASQVIETLAQAYPNGEMLIGAGTVLDPETARAAILAGARFVVSPCLNVEVVQLCNRYCIPCIPGAMTIKEVVEALQAGAAMIKAFPGEVLGTSFIKAVLGPLPYARLVPTGGVSLENVGQWIKAGAVAIGAGGSLTAGAKTGDYAAITHLASQFVERIKLARAEK